MLFDFYGELLTVKQREYFDLYYNDDLSLGEIAEIDGITRQGVRDILRRAENILLETERKTGLIERFEINLRTVSEIEACVGKISSRSSDPVIEELVGEICKNLEILRQ